jgi:hypothetical protein
MPITLEQKKPHINQVKLSRWYELANQMKALKDEEATLRKELFSECFPVYKEGTNKLDLTEGWVLKVTVPVNRKVDEAAFAAYKEVLIANNISPDKLVRWKAELAVSFYKTLDDEEKELVDQFLTISDGSPQMEIVLPAKNKK